MAFDIQFKLIYQGIRDVFRVRSLSYYYRGLKEWGREAGYLRDTCLTAQDRFRKLLAYYRPDFVKMQP